MPRRRQQHEPLAYAIVPRALVRLLAQGRIDSTALAVWTVIRLHVKDTDRGTFSPSPVDLTNREIAEWTGMTIRGAVKVLNRLEEVGLMRRLSEEQVAELGLSNTRWLQLLTPERLNPSSMNPHSMNQDSLNLEEASLEPLDLVAQPGSSLRSASSCLEGGSGGGKGEPPFNESQFNESQFNESRFNESQFTLIVSQLQECGVYKTPAQEIARRMLKDQPDCTPEWAADTFYHVFRQEYKHGQQKPETAVARTVSRLKDGDWGTKLEAVVAEVEQRHREELGQYNPPADDWPADPPWSLRPVDLLWRQTLDVLSLQLTRATFDTWLRDSKAIDINGDGQTLVVQVKNEYAVGWLQGRLKARVETAVAHAAEYLPEHTFPETLTVRFVWASPDSNNLHEEKDL